MKQVSVFLKSLPFILFTAAYTALIYTIREYLKLGVAVGAFISPLLGVIAFALIAGVCAFIALLLSSIGHKQNVGGMKARLFNKGNLIRAGVMAAVVIAALVIPIIRSNISDKLDKAAAKKAYEQADEIIKYRNDNTFTPDLWGTPLNRDAVLIDYDSMKVTFLYTSHGDVELEMIAQTELKKASPEDMADPVQFQYRLSGKGRMLRVYSDDNDAQIHYRSSGVSVEMEDGSFWYGSFMKTYKGRDFGIPLNLESNDGQKLKNIIDSSDEIVQYGSGDPFGDYGLDITASTIGIDYDTMELHIANASERGKLYTYDTELKETELTREYIDGKGTVTAAIPLSKGTLYTVGHRESWQDEQCMLIVFAGSDGRFYSTPDDWWQLLDLSTGKYRTDMEHIPGIE